MPTTQPHQPISKQPRGSGGLAPGATEGAEPARRAFPQAGENTPSAVENADLVSAASAASEATRPTVRAAITRQIDGRYLLALQSVDSEGARIAGLGIAGIYSTLGCAMAAAYGHAWQSGAALQGIGMGTVLTGS